MNLSEGWTDDMRVALRQGRTESELVALVMDALIKRRDVMSLVPIMREDFGMTEDDIELAFDRIQGGIVRAIIGNAANEPNQDKDPLAWHSFHVVWKKLPRKSFFSKERLPSGPWYEWFKETRKDLYNIPHSSALGPAADTPSR